MFQIFFNKFLFLCVGCIKIVIHVITKVFFSSSSNFRQEFIIGMDLSQALQQIQSTTRVAKLYGKFCNIGNVINIYENTVPSDVKSIARKIYGFQKYRLFFLTMVCIIKCVLLFQCTCYKCIDVKMVVKYGKQNNIYRRL